MLKKIFKWLGIFFGCLLLLLLVFYGIVYLKTESRANKIYTVNIQPLRIPTDSASLILGAHVAAVRACNDCHASGGVPFLDEKNPIALLYTANLTSGKGGISYTNEDWIRTLRHGVGKDGKSVWFMPSQHTSAGLSNKELAALICYLKQLPAVNKINPQKVMKPLGRILTFLDKFPMFTAEFIDHHAIFPDEVKPEATAAYGKYLVNSCQGCHGNSFKGAPSHGDGEPPIPDISSTGNIGRWTSESFMTTMHTGKTPERKKLSSAMPWKQIGEACSGEELQAIYLYLHAAK